MNKRIVFSDENNYITRQTVRTTGLSRFLSRITGGYITTQKQIGVIGLFFIGLLIVLNIWLQYKTQGSDLSNNSIYQAHQKNHHPQ